MLAVRVATMRRLGSAALFALALAAAASTVRAEDPPATLATLLDRAQIEDILVDYYTNLGGSDRGFGSYYLPDGVLDVNGIVAQGKAAIEELYRRTAQGTPRRPGTFHMLLSNPRIIVAGDTATADVVWTGINSASPKATPRFIEQGREHDELVKRNGRWYFKHRTITSDGGLPAMFEKTYRKR
ncbi:MAG TPA: nuclear transport factor 2 family protein [Steroidobacteraceae bacterium]|nr:nuclear transport factor 2 family protein [Steroidobacteraceae bacterium]